MSTAINTHLCKEIAKAPPAPVKMNVKVLQLAVNNWMDAWWNPNRSTQTNPTAVSHPHGSYCAHMGFWMAIALGHWTMDPPITFTAEEQRLARQVYEMLQRKYDEIRNQTAGTSAFAKLYDVVRNTPNQPAPAPNEDHIF